MSGSALAGDNVKPLPLDLSTYHPVCSLSAILSTVNVYLVYAPLCDLLFTQLALKCVCFTNCASKCLHLNAGKPFQLCHGDVPACPMQQR